MIDTELQPSIEGTMQRGPLSPILANILLDDFDKEMESRGLHFVRYADDFLVFTKTSEAAQRVARSIEDYLTRKLKLVVNHDKSRRGTIARVSQGRGTGESIHNLAEAHCKEMNRPVRTRTPGGVGGPWSNPGPYPDPCSPLSVTGRLKQLIFADYTRVTVAFAHEYENAL